MREDSALGLYVHVPFCARHCEFCAFYEEPPHKADIERYLAGVEKELARLKLPGPVGTVFWGGGTPSLLLPRDLERLARATLSVCGGAPSEWTVETTPATARPDRLCVLKDVGVTRISIGVQSFNERILTDLGRIHTTRQVEAAIRAVRDAGFANLNLDMMFALPGQELSEWESDLARAIALRPDHISTYCLSFEEDAPLYLRLMRGRTTKRTPDEEAAFYERTWDILEAAGYRQYEVSNFSHAGHECVHNCNTWRMRQWAGVGPSAASQIGMRRYANVPSLSQWLAGIESGRPALKDVVELDEETLATDAIVFGIRMVDGVDLDELSARFPGFDWGKTAAKARELAQEGFAEFDGRIFRLTRKGRLLADEVALEFM
ncbi:MAG TPA: radical SAM family heme chaperone HemW [Opitutales bacterium]|nr:radical SAM family heme chaperone HemW [Opitutales bacterium]